MASPVPTDGEDATAASPVPPDEDDGTTLPRRAATQIDGRAATPRVTSEHAMVWNWSGIMVWVSTPRRGGFMESKQGVGWLYSQNASLQV
jgi:hypothetical protein